KQYNQAELDAGRDVAISSSQPNDLNQHRAPHQLKDTAAKTPTGSARAHYHRRLLTRHTAQQPRRAVLAPSLIQI
ncbi:multidrug resistance transporter, partial [Klebsiella pneumoniae]|nr:multidrug resistance transporter [Klebsiella pneumoniae]